MTLNSQELILKLQEAIEITLQPLINASRKVAILDFPNHSNVGDSAIFLGEIAYLNKHKIKLSYCCDLASCSIPALRKSLGDGTILLHGGGNFGDVWPNHQKFREDIIQAFPANKIIQLPQTIRFSDQHALKRSAKILSKHPDFTLLVRDKISLKISREDLKVTSQLCPDMAFMIGCINQKVAQSHGVVWLVRTDRESGAGFKSIHSHKKTVDWLIEPTSILISAFNGINKKIVYYPNKLGWLNRFISRLYVAVALKRLQFGINLLNSGQSVVTDRLHGHILCILLNKQHLLFDNSYGKIKTFYELWTHNYHGCQWVDTIKEALVLLNEHVAESEQERLHEN